MRLAAVLISVVLSGSGDDLSLRSGTGLPSPGEPAVATIELAPLADGAYPGVVALERYPDGR